MRVYASAYKERENIFSNILYKSNTRSKHEINLYYIYVTRMKFPYHLI